MFQNVLFQAREEKPLFIGSQVKPHSSDDSEAKTGTSRLARNRRTARLRRERKKQEAEILTAQLNEAATQLDNMKNNLSVDMREEFESLKNESFKKASSSGCLFCDKSFLINEYDRRYPEHAELKKHYLSEHPHDIKSSYSYLGNDFLETVTQPEDLLNLIEELSKESAQKVSGKSGEESSDAMSRRGSTTETIINSDSDDNVCVPGAHVTAYRRMSVEDKRKRRLERNAESARLCRQRKKLYIQKIRLQLPAVVREKKLLDDFLENYANVNKAHGGETSMKFKENRRSTIIPKLNGWDSSLKKSKRNLSYNNLANLQTAQAKRMNSMNMVDPSVTQSLAQPLHFGLPPLFELSRLSQTFNQLALANSLGILPQTPPSFPPMRQNPNAEKDVFEAAFALSNLGSKLN